MRHGNLIYWRFCWTWWQRRSALSSNKSISLCVCSWLFCSRQAGNGHGMGSLVPSTRTWTGNKLCFSKSPKIDSDFRRILLECCWKAILCSLQEHQCIPYMYVNRNACIYRGSFWYLCKLAVCHLVSCPLSTVDPKSHRHHCNDEVTDKNASARARAGRT